MATSELQVVTGGQPSLSNFNREQIDVIKRTVARGVSDAELSMFLTLAGRYQLDPFLKEIWCYKRQKKNASGSYEDDPNAPAVIMTSRDGYLKVAQRDSNFDGLKAFVVREGDTFEVDAVEDKIIHKFGAKRGKILGAWAACYHKERRPSICFVDFEEYNAYTNTWKKNPSAMIQKVAEAFVLKRQFGINGLVTMEEMETDYSPSDLNMNGTQQLSAPQKAEPLKNLWLEAANALKEIAHEVGVTDDELRTIGERFTGKKDIRKWSPDEMRAIADYLEQPVKEEKVDEPSTTASTTTLDLPSDDELPF